MDWPGSKAAEKRRASHAGLARLAGKAAD